MRSDYERIVDIQETIQHIEKYAIRRKEAFEKDELIQSWIVRHLQIIGEAASRLSEHFRKSHSEIPWSNIIGMHNILVHDYFEIDKSIVWAAVENELPNLKIHINKIIENKA
ncbi:nucleotidyltransferase [bacterium SM23_31]|nr:MAG: nucleotidyltransferase [bacterium SM23_31]